MTGFYSIDRWSLNRRGSYSRFKCIDRWSLNRGDSYNRFTLDAGGLYIEVEVVAMAGFTVQTYLNVELIAITGFA